MQWDALRDVCWEYFDGDYERRWVVTPEGVGGALVVPARDAPPRAEGDAAWSACLFGTDGACQLRHDWAGGGWEVVGQFRDAEQLRALLAVWCPLASEEERVEAGVAAFDARLAAARWQLRDRLRESLGAAVRCMRGVPAHVQGAALWTRAWPAAEAALRRVFTAEAALAVAVD